VALLNSRDVAISLCVPQVSEPPSASLCTQTWSPLQLSPRMRSSTVIRLLPQTLIIIMNHARLAPGFPVAPTLSKLLVQSPFFPLPPPSCFHCWPGSYIPLHTSQPSTALSQVNPSSFLSCCHPTQSLLASPPFFSYPFLSLSTSTS